jgi:hypothetical protein
MVERLANLADARNDAVGLALEEERLPQRIRRSRGERPLDVGPKSDGD